MPNATSANCEKFLLYLNDAMDKYDIYSPMRQAHFLAQIAWESGSLKFVKENLNYSAEALARTFPRYFTVAMAAKFARQPQKIANIVYGGRMGNDNNGDGWRFIGRGLIQLTGKNNYKAYGNAVGIDFTIEGNWEQLATPKYAADSAAWFWQTHGLNELADKDEFTKITKIINGSTASVPKRLPYLGNAKRALGLLKK